MTFDEFMDIVTDPRLHDIGENDLTYECEFTFRSSVRIPGRFITPQDREEMLQAAKHYIASNMWHRLNEEFRDDSKIEDAYYNGYMDAKKLMPPSYGGCR